MKLYMFRTVPLSIIRSLFTVYSAVVYVIQVFRRLSSMIRMEQSTILILLENCLMMDRGTVRNMWSVTPKQIYETSASSWFYYKEICYDAARSLERKKRWLFYS